MASEMEKLGGVPMPSAEKEAPKTKRELYDEWLRASAVVLESCGVEKVPDLEPTAIKHTPTLDEEVRSTIMRADAIHQERQQRFTSSLLPSPLI